ncbi:MAG: thiamine pyrophosphate-dependent enzyme [Candidatus Thermoplasmatota archaeon]
MITAEEIRDKYVRNHPSPFCPGCGGGMVLNAMSRAVESSRVEKEDVVAVSGIGCAAWIPSPHWRVDTLHTTHGRAIAFASGVKIADRGLEVMVVSGDGDCAGIGGNHLLHGARNNIDLNVLMVNNGLYAMTGGQVAPTTEHDEKTLTTPYGNPASSFEAAEVVKAAGASHVARWTTYHMNELVDEVEKAIETEGFSFIEILTQCPTRKGKKEGMNGVEMLEWYEENTSKDEESDKMYVGTLTEIQRPELTEEIYKQIDRFRGD